MYEPMKPLAPVTATVPEATAGIVRVCSCGGEGPPRTSRSLVNFLTALGGLGFRWLTGAEFLRHYSRTATEPPIDVMAFLKPRLETRSTHPSARATDIMVADATSEKVGISSSDRRRRGRSGGTVAATLTFTA